MVFGPLLGRLADRSDMLTMEKACLGLVLCCSVAIAMCVQLRFPSDLMSSSGVARTRWLLAVYCHLVVVGVSMPIFQICHLPLLKAAVPTSAASVANALAMCCFGMYAHHSLPASVLEAV